MLPRSGSASATTSRSRSGRLSSTPSGTRLGLDKPLPVQFEIWLTKAVQGDFGTQEGGGAVGPAVGERIVPSLELALLTLVVSLPLAALLAVRSVRRGQARLLDGDRPALHGRVRDPAVLARDPARDPVRGPARLAPGRRVRGVSGGAGRAHQATADAADHARDPDHGRLLPLHASEPAGVAADAVHPDRTCEGPERERGALQSRPAERAPAVADGARRPVRTASSAAWSSSSGSSTGPGSVVYSCTRSRGRTSTR